MKFQSTISFADANPKESYYRLETGNLSDRELFRTISKALDRIEENVFCGIQIPKRLIPKEYVEKYNVRNLWKYNLPKGWRIIYSILGDQIIIISLVIEWMNHKHYERRFNY